MVSRLSGSLAALLLLVQPGGAIADDRRGGELGPVLGGIASDSDLSGESGNVDPLLGLRAGTVFSRDWGAYIDVLGTEIGTAGPLGDARTFVGRAGIDRLFNPLKDNRWFVTAGFGWIAVDFDNAALEDFHNPIGSIGFGQRARVAANWRVRWELRADHTLDDARLNGEDLFQGLALIGVTWGPSASPRGFARDDLDRDGVRDGRDRCPDTPADTVVDRRGCPLDDDRDGVFNGLDRCPFSERGSAVGPDGCPADSDGDGVADVTDICVDTLAGARVDEWGCPTDGDGDGIYDGLDRCPDTPFRAKVDPAGCPSDRDGDGVFDGVDRCPDTRPGAPVGPFGCLVDDDADGVENGVDQCPATPAGTPVDERGCKRQAPLFEGGRSTLVLEGVQFETGSSQLDPTAQRVLRRVARDLASHPSVRVEVAGHTDASGSAETNLALSTRRAEAVRSFLIGQGIDAGRVVARGYGDSQPVADNGDPAGRARNRRVELRRLTD